MDNRPVGIFDSGLGGLTAVREFKKLLPHENIIYFGDTGRMPYGARPAGQIRVIAGQNLAFVAGHGTKAMIAACGTISSTAGDILCRCETPVCGVLKPGVRELCAAPPAVVGVIATATSIQSGAYERAIKALCPEKTVVAISCPKFVPLIEAGRYDKDDPAVRAAMEEYLAPMKQAGVGALLLGCTHYGLIGDAIDDYFGGRVALLGAADAAARELTRYLTQNGLLGDGDGEDRFYTSGSVEEFERLGKQFLGRDLTGRVEYIPPFPV